MTDHFIIFHREYDLRMFADDKAELHEKLAEITQPEGYVVFELDPGSIGHGGDGAHLSIRTRDAVSDMYAKVDFCAVSDPNNPEASFPPFVAFHLADVIRDEYAAYLAERVAA